MTYQTVISTAELAANLAMDSTAWVVVDCRFALADTDLGRREYRRSHIPGAVYAHLDEELSGPIIPGQTGRHPLPAIDAFATKLGQWGIDNDTQVVAYDSFNSAFAARLWWMLRWLGHTAVAVLDGGWPRWEQENRPTTAEIPSPKPRTFTPHPRPELALDADAIAKIAGDATCRLVDSRSPERYRGENETLDPVAGHIPGAISLFYADHVNPDGSFLPAEQIKSRFEDMLGDAPAEKTVFYCGSGVTAAHNVLAMTYAGLGEARLYPGSWSEWITDPHRPIATGEE